MHARQAYYWATSPGLLYLVRNSGYCKWGSLINFGKSMG
jgi:hypothetical protein